eukprot:15349708-Ditylum_brightwellii.AAC.1
MTNLTFLEKFRGIINIVKEHGGVLALHPSLIEDEMPETEVDEGPDKATLKGHREFSQEKFFAHCFIKKMCKICYEGLLKQLHNDSLLGRASYPDTEDGAYDLINSWQDKARLQSMGSGTNGAVSFSTIGEEEEKKDGDDEVVPPKDEGKTRPDIKCYKCKKKGHFADNCPSEQGHTMFTMGATEAFQFTTLCHECTDIAMETDDTDEPYTQGDFIFTNISEVGRKVHKRGQLSKNWILLDSQSTVSIMSNADLVTNIRKAPMMLYMGKYAGKAHTDLICDFGGWGTTWFHPNGIANILALHKAKDKWRVTYDSKGGNAFVIHKADCHILFIESDNGLYYHDVTDGSIVLDDETREQGEHIMLVSTVE